VTHLVIHMMVVMNCIDPIAWQRSLRLRPEAPECPEVIRDGLEGPHPEAPRSGLEGRSKRRHPKASFMADQRGAVAFETMIVYLFMVTSLLLPLADVAAAGFQFISGWEALRGFGQYVQYHPPQDVTNPTWTPPLPTTVAGYPINNVKVLCGDTGAGVACTSANIKTSTGNTKYYSYTTTVTVAPLVLRRALCPTSCTYTLTSTERFQ
jgi:hypothetical protein